MRWRGRLGRRRDMGRWSYCAAVATGAVAAVCGIGRCTSAG